MHYFITKLKTKIDVIPRIEPLGRKNLTEIIIHLLKENTELIVLL